MNTMERITRHEIDAEKDYILAKYREGYLDAIEDGYNDSDAVDVAMETVIYALLEGPNNSVSNMYDRYNLYPCDNWKELSDEDMELLQEDIDTVNYTLETYVPEIIRKG